MKFNTRNEAVKILKEKGLRRMTSRANREYWAFDDGSDSMLDHSATITKMSDGYHVSDFTHLRKLAK